MQKLFAIVVIWVGCAAAWMLLGSTIVYRGGDTRSELDGEVYRLWGPPTVQAPPSGLVHAVELEEPSTREEQERAEGGPAPLVASDIDVALELEHRKKGLLWFATYAADFSARYTFKNPSVEDRDVTVTFPLAGAGLIYDAFEILDGEGKPVDAAISGHAATWTERFSAGDERSYQVIYRSRGIESWSYNAPTDTAKIQNFELRLAVNTPAVDFAAGTISPSEHAFDGSAWHGTWHFDSLVASAPIGVELPKKVNPGPLAAKITFFAPVSLLFFFFVVAILAAHRRKNIHPMNYFFLGTAFFAFHLLFAYLVDHVSVLPSFTISAIVSTLLVVSYARLFVGWRFAVIEVGLSQLIYLVLFSFTFFWTGMTGLAVTIGAVLTLFVIMQITGRTSWSEVFASMRPQAAAHSPPHGPQPPPATAAGRA